MNNVKVAKRLVMLAGVLLADKKQASNPSKNMTDRYQIALLDIKEQGLLMEMSAVTKLRAFKSELTQGNLSNGDSARLERRIEDAERVVSMLGNISDILKGI